MDKRPTVLASRLLGYAIDHLSKNTLIDLVVDRARAQIGEEASDEALADEIQNWIRPVLAARGDKPISLDAIMKRRLTSDEKYRLTHGL